MDIIKTDGLNVICGRTGGGKSTLAKFIIFQLLKSRKVDNCIVFTMTPTDYEYLPPQCIHTLIKEEQLGLILNYQKNHPNLKMLIVFDDFIGAINFQWPICNVMNTQYRHHGLTVLYSVQYIYSIPPIVREVVDVTILFSQNTERSIRACYECFGQDFAKLADFQQFLSNRTQGYNFLIINNKITDKNKKFKQAVVDINRIPRGKIEFKEDKVEKK